MFLYSLPVSNEIVVAFILIYSVCVAGQKKKGMAEKKRKHILLLEPYYGGSHKAFLHGLSRYVDMEFTLVTLPARKWKMRMQTAAPWLAEQIVDLCKNGEHFDGMLCSTFLDLAVLRSLLARAGIWLPAAVYFHENQFAYPGRIRDPGYFQFTGINLSTALCADLLAFNSRFNFDSFLSGIRKFIAKVSDVSLHDVIAQIQAKSSVLYPGLDFSDIDNIAPQPRSGTPVLIWNHRWEHDKNPNTFFHALYELDATGVDFGLIVLGQNFHDRPPVFAEAEKRLARHIIHFGYVNDRARYVRLLHQGDLVVSTAGHEFFGMSVLEAARAGCRPLVPDRLSYVELYADQFRYRSGSLVKTLRAALASLPDQEGRGEYSKIATPYAWPSLAGRYTAWLDELCSMPLPAFLDNC